MPRSLPHRLALGFLRGLLYVVAGILVLVIGGMIAIQTGWAKNELRRVIVHEANQYLTATLEIGRLEGSVFRDLTLGDVRLTRNGQTIISADAIELHFSIKELLSPGTTLRSIRLTRPRIVFARVPDGRWNLAALLNRQGRENERTGPGRPLHLLAIEVVDGDVTFLDPLLSGDVHAPSHFARLNVSASFDYAPVTWRVNLASASWAGDATNLAVNMVTGGISDGPAGWQFDAVSVQTPQSAFTLTGRVNRVPAPPAASAGVALDLHVAAKRFVFQEWANVVEALGHINIDSTFDLTLKGPPPAIATNLTLRSTEGTSGGDIQGQFTLNTAVEGWHGAGTASVARVNIARWLDEEDRPSDITGRLTFDLELMPPGLHFPKGAFDFVGPHAAYLGYEMENLRTHGTLTDRDAVIADLAGTAYGSPLHITAGTVGLDAPNPYHFEGTATGVDLRKLPDSVPITHVESLLALNTFDVAGQFTPLLLKGNAQLGDSTYLGASIAAGAVGAIDTSVTPVRFSGEGTVSSLDIHRFGEGLDTEWMLDPRWAGIVAGHFHMEGTGSEPATRTLDGGGRLARADMFGGRLSDADVEVHIAGGSLKGSYNGALAGIDMARAFADPRFEATITGTGQAHFAVNDILLRPATIADYTADGTLDVSGSIVRGIPLDSGSLAATLTDSTLNVSSLHASGPKIEATGSGTLELDGERSSQFAYKVASADMSLANDASGRHLSGTIATTGQLTGPTTVLRLTGDATVSDLHDLDVAGTDILTTTAQYDVTVPDDSAQITARVTAHAVSIEAAGQQFPEADAAVTYNATHLDADVHIGTDKHVVGSMVVHPDGKGIDLSALAVSVGASAWRLANPTPPPTITWNASGPGTPGGPGGIDMMPLVFEQTTTTTGATITPAAAAATATPARLIVSGTWRADGSGTLKLDGDHLVMDTLLDPTDKSPIYGGVADVHATISGTTDRPTAKGDISVVDGRVRKLAYQKFGGHVEFDNNRLQMDLRLDQAPGIWLTAKGGVPFDLTSNGQPDQPIDLAVDSSTVALGLLEGLTGVVHNVSGQLTLNMKVSGTSKAPRFDGNVKLADTAFVVASTGARYQRGAAEFTLADDRVNVSSFHLEDRKGRPLSVTGSMGTNALTVGDLQIDIVANGFEILHNDTGSVDVNAHLALRGDLNAPRLAGDVTVLSGELSVDEIFAQKLYQPYSIQATGGPTAPTLVTPTAPATSTAPGVAGAPGAPAAAAKGAAAVDTIAALNPWDRLALEITLHSRGTLRLTGDNIQVAQGTPLGLGSFNIRATGDLYLSKAAGGPVYPSGSFDSIAGSLSFQGRRFDIDPTSSVNFHGDTDPELYVTVTRLISGVDARVTIMGTVSQPELRLASTPPLESSDILSLIVFNSSTNELSGPQQQELAVRAGTLAYGFVATPLINALQRSIGLDTLEIALPGPTDTGPRVTVGNEFVPGLVAQFTRQFGEEAYDEATVEYYISRIFRIRATFSDADSLSAVSRSPFQRIERAGIDLLLFFSF
jgi:autotransporter translocation and assembly factor TamB